MHGAINIHRVVFDDDGHAYLTGFDLGTSAEATDGAPDRRMFYELAATMFDLEGEHRAPLGGVFDVALYSDEPYTRIARFPASPTTGGGR